VRIIQKVATGVAESESSGSDELRGILQRGPKLRELLPALIDPRTTSGYDARDAEPACNPSVVGQGNPRVAGAVNYRERSTRLKDGYA